MVLSCLRQLFASLPMRRTGFNPRLVHVDFVIDKVALEQEFLSKLRVFPSLSRIAPKLILNIITLLLLEQTILGNLRTKQFSLAYRGISNARSMFRWDILLSGFAGYFEGKLQKVKVKIKFILEQAPKSQRGSRGIALLYL
jgi:hypothetical protein